MANQRKRGTKMMEKAKVETRSFNGVRVVVHTSLTYDVVLGKLRHGRVNRR